ncbi:hypothetical protein L9F63_012888, partial [Diploptera punctata]
LPEFAVHAQLGLPPPPFDPFWPGALGFGPAVFGIGGIPPNAAATAAALGIPWGGKTPPPAPIHTLLSQYVLAGGALPLSSSFGIGGLGAFGLQPPPPPTAAAGSPPPTESESRPSLRVLPHLPVRRLLLPRQKLRRHLQRISQCSKFKQNLKISYEIVRHTNVKIVLRIMEYHIECNL